jgi:hypothetical protein
MAGVLDGVFDDGPLECAGGKVRTVTSLLFSAALSRAGDALTAAGEAGRVAAARGLAAAGWDVEAKTCAGAALAGDLPGDGCAATGAD